MRGHTENIVQNELAQWWRPEAPAERLSGTLFEKSDGAGMRLLVDGHFAAAESEPATEGVPRSVSPPFDDVPLLLGVTASGKRLSLIDCHVVRSSGLPGFTKTSQVLRPKIIAYDVHFESADRFCLTSLSGRYSNLDEWVNTSGFSYTYPTGALYSLSVTYAKPEEVKATLSNGTSVHIAFSVHGPDHGPKTEVNIRQQAWLSVRSAEERSYEELLRALTTVADFVSLGIGQAVRPLDLRAGVLDDESRQDNQGTIYFRLQHNSEPIAPLRKDIDSYDMLFTLSDIRENFTDILEAWCIRQEKLRPLYSLYVGTLKSPNMYVEHRFLNMFQALESFDRRDFALTVEALDKYNQRKQPNS